MAGKHDESKGSPPVTRRRSRVFVLIALLAGMAMLVVILIEVGLWRAMVCLEDREHDAARRWLSVVQVLQADRAEFHYLMARTHRRLGEFSEVEKHLRLALDQGWDVRQLEREQWMALAQSGQFSQVNRHWDELFQNAGSDLPEVAGSYARGALELLRINDALRVVAIWKKNYPDDPEPYVVEARISDSGLAWKAAAKSYREAISRSSPRSDLHRDLGRVLLELGELEGARQQLQASINLKSDDVETLVILGRCANKAGNPDDARRWFEQAIEVDAGTKAARKELASLEASVGNYEAALTWIVPVVDVHQEDAQARYTLARALRATGRPDEAVIHDNFVKESSQPLQDLGLQMQQLLNDPTNVDLRFQIAATTYRYKSKKEGAEWLRSLLKMAPDHGPAHQLLADFYSSIGDEAQAARHRGQRRESP